KQPVRLHDYRLLCDGLCRHVGKFGGNEAASEQHYSFRQLRELDEVSAREQMLLAANAEVHRHGTHRDQDETAVEHFDVHLDRARPTKLRAAMVGVDSSFGETLLLHRRHGFSEASFETDKLVPCDYGLAAADTFATHTAGMIDGVCRADQDL